MNRLITRTAISTSLALVLLLASAITVDAQTAFTPPRDKPGERARYEHERLKDPATGTIPNNIRTREQVFGASLPNRQSALLAKGRAAVMSDLWTARGPFTVGGRTRAFAIDVANENNMLAGGSSGGMWRSIDGGQSWVRTTLQHQIPSVTCVAQDTRPGKTNTWYYGTGERSGSTSHIPGDGIFKSTDNGMTWEQIPSTVSGTPHEQDTFDFIWRIAIDPSRQDSSIVYAAVVGGVYRSADGGTTWSRVLGVAPTAGGPPDLTDLAVTSEGVVYATLSDRSGGGGTASVRGVYRSTDGLTWTRINPSSFGSRFGRIVLAVVPSDERNVYFLGEFSQPPYYGLYKYTYVSGDGSGTGGTWANFTSGIPIADNWMTGFNSQGSYNLAIAVHPQDENIVAVGSTNIFLSTNGFSAPGNARLIGGYNPDYNNSLEGWKEMMYPDHHSDIHFLTFLPSNPSILFSAGDGGVHLTDDYTAARVAWMPLNNGYATTQFYTVAINQHISGDQTVIGGLQDNHTYGSPAPGADWEWLAGGDGSYCAIPADNSLYYVSAQGAYLCRTKVDAEFRYESMDLLRTDNLGDAFQFIAPFLLDPNDSDVMYLASMQGIWRADNMSTIGSPLWTQVARAPANTYISTLAMSTQPANVLYYGTYSRALYRLDNAHVSSGTPRRISHPGFPSAAMSCIAVDPQNADRVIVVFSNYGVPSLFYTEDGGDTWTDISGNLEQNPDGSGAGPSCNWAEIAHTPNGGTMFLVGTSVGLFSTNALNGQQTQWVQEGVNAFGMSDVRMIRVRQSDGFVAVATHGGGIFTGNISATTSVGENTPEVFFLEQNYPNPCNDKTTIGFSVPESQHITIKVLDAFGTVLATPVDGTVESGYHTRVLDTEDLAAGRYYIRMEAGRFAQTRLLTVVR